MKKLLKPANIAFYFLMFLVFAMLGLFYAGFIDAGKNQGLAGGAIVLGYGLLFGGLAFIASFFIAYRLEVKKTVRINWVLLVTLLITWGFKYYQLQQRDQLQQEKKEQFKPAPTSYNKLFTLKNQPIMKERGSYKKT